jgi:putative acetyltransferase
VKARVRAEQPRDRERVQAIQEAAFERPDEARLVDALRGAVAPLVSLVAEVDGRVLGHVLFSPVTIAGAPDAPACCGLGPVGVDPAVQGQGLGGALIREGLGRAREAGFAVCFVLGNPKYYGRFGFQPAAPRGFHYHSEAYDLAFQVQELVPGALAGVSGYVRYADAFEGL